MKEASLGKSSPPVLGDFRKFSNTEKFQKLGSGRMCCIIKLYLYPPAKTEALNAKPNRPKFKIALPQLYDFRVYYFAAASLEQSIVIGNGAEIISPFPQEHSLLLPKHLGFLMYLFLRKRRCRDVLRLFLRIRR